MEKDLDMKLYKDYLKGNKKSFELLYTKYKSKIEYFIFNIVKDHEKAEDITQDVFIEIIKNEIKEGYSFKYHIFLLAKSRALNYLNGEKRRNEINEKYIYHENEKKEKDALEIITNKETKEELLEAINMLEDKYKNVLFLVKIEELSYNETAEILGQSVQNIKNLVHRGKNELRKILIKKGFNEMNKALKIFIIVVCTTVLLSGIVYATTQIIKAISKNNNVTFNPSYQSTLNQNESNDIWIGTFELAWNELAKKVGKGNKVELTEEVQIANELNNSTFSKKMLSKDDYSIEITKNDIGGFNIYATLEKNLSFMHTFDNFSNDFKTYTFGDKQTHSEDIKYFGINNASSEKLNENVEVLFYNQKSELAKSNDFAVTLKTKEGDEIILYRTNEKKSFDQYYNDIQNKANRYTGNKRFLEYDELLIPYINLNGMISYNELKGKTIKNTNMYIENAVQTVNFYLNEKGCNLDSKATMVIGSYADSDRCFEFTDTFVLFIKEKDSTVPYFALKVDNSDILEKKDESNKIQIIDYTIIEPEMYSVEDAEYKFYEDENYRYFYPTKKTEFVQVFYKEGNIRSETVEEALKNGRISMVFLDKYEVEYIKKEK